MSKALLIAVCMILWVFLINPIFPIIPRYIITPWSAAYSVFTYFTESFSLDSSKTTERMVKNPMWLRHTVTKIFAKNHSVKLVNALYLFRYTLNNTTGLSILKKLARLEQLTDP